MIKHKKAKKNVLKQKIDLKKLSRMQNIDIKLWKLLRSSLKMLKIE